MAHLLCPETCEAPDSKLSPVAITFIILGAVVAAVGIGVGIAACSGAFSSAGIITVSPMQKAFAAAPLLTDFE